MKNKLIVIKLGGNATKQLTTSFFNQLQMWIEMGIEILIVHGGGPQITELSQRLHLKADKIDGIRVTDAATLNITREILLGLVQPQLCATLVQHGLPVIGLNTSDNQLLLGTYLNQSKYGLVGQIEQINSTWLHHQLKQQIGVLAPLAMTTDGQWLNVNADQAAADIAVLLGADRLVMLTDVPGVISNGQIINSIDEQLSSKLINQSVIKSGMQPKIKAAFRALHQGVARVSITNDLTNQGTVMYAVS